MKGNIKCNSCRFEPPFGGLRDNAQGLSMARWKAHCRLPVNDNWTFLISSHGCGTIKRNLSKSAFSEGVGHFERKFFSERTKLRSLYAIGRPSVCLSVCLLSVVCLSVCDVGAPYSGGWTFRQFFSPYESSGTLLFCCQKSLVGDAPFPLKFAFKVTHPLQNSEISTNIGS